MWVVAAKRNIFAQRFSYFSKRFIDAINVGFDV